MVHINISELKNYIEKNTIKTQSHKDPKKCCKPWSFLCQKCRNQMYNGVQSNLKCPTLKMTEKLHDIDKPNSFPCLQGQSSSFQELFEPILNKELKSRQSNNLPLYARTLIHLFNFHFLVNESSRTSKNVLILHHGHQITSWQINSYIKK